MWISVLESGGGRINLALASRFYTQAAGGGLFDVYVKAAGENVRVLAGFTSQADALAAIDNLLLNGS